MICHILCPERVSNYYSISKGLPSLVRWWRWARDLAVERNLSLEAPSASHTHFDYYKLMGSSLAVVGMQLEPPKSDSSASNTLLLSWPPWVLKELSQTGLVWRRRRRWFWEVDDDMEKCRLGWSVSCHFLTYPDLCWKIATLSCFLDVATHPKLPLQPAFYIFIFILSK